MLPLILKLPVLIHLICVVTADSVDQDTRKNIERENAYKELNELMSHQGFRATDSAYFADADMVNKDRQLIIRPNSGAISFNIQEVIHPLLQPFYYIGIIAGGIKGIILKPIAIILELFLGTIYLTGKIAFQISTNPLDLDRLFEQVINSSLANFVLFVEIMIRVAYYYAINEENE